MEYPSKIRNRSRVCSLSCRTATTRRGRAMWTSPRMGLRTSERWARLMGGGLCRVSVEIRALLLQGGRMFVRVLQSGLCTACWGIIDLVLDGCFCSYSCWVYKQRPRYSSSCSYLHYYKVITKMISLFLLKSDPLIRRPTVLCPNLVMKIIYVQDPVNSFGP